METKIRNFPYPIITDITGDYTNSTFESNLNVNHEGQAIKFEFNYNLNNKSIERLIKDKKATVFFHLECPQTSFREKYELDSTQSSISIEGTNLNGKIEVSSFIVVTKDISRFSDEYFSDIFKGYTFNFEVGSIIGVGTQFAVTVEKDIEDLANVASIFKLIKSPLTDSIEYQIGDKQIAIYLSEKDFDAYFSLRQQILLQSILSSMIIIPVLTNVLTEIKNSSLEDLESYSDKNWFRSLSKQFKERFDIDIMQGQLTSQTNSMFYYAQGIIGQPTSVGLQTLLHGYSEITMEEGDEIL